MYYFLCLFTLVFLSLICLFYDYDGFVFITAKLFSLQLAHIRDGENLPGAKEATVQPCFVSF